MGIDGQVKRSIKVLSRSKDDVIPREVIELCSGIAFMTYVKGAYLFSGTIGKGIVVRRLGNRKWSAPSAIVTGGMGVGLQIGGQKADIILIFNEQSAIDTFMSRGQLKVGADYALTAGPVGRTIQADLRMSRKGFSGVFSYSRSQGAFVGVSLESALLFTNSIENKSYYKSKNSVPSILNGDVYPKGDKYHNLESLWEAMNAAADGKLIGSTVELGSQETLGSETSQLSSTVKKQAMLAKEQQDQKALEEAAAAAGTTAPPLNPAVPAAAAATAAATTAAAPQPTAVPQAAAPVPQAAAPVAAPAAAAAPAVDLLSGGIFDDSAPLLLPTPSATNMAQPQGFGSLQYVPAAVPQQQQPQMAAPPPQQQADPFAGLSTTPVDGRALYGAAIGVQQQQPPMPQQQPAGLVNVVRDHVVNEADPNFGGHGIISVHIGEQVQVLSTTLPPPYQDYAQVMLRNGKQGKVSKYVLAL